MMILFNNETMIIGQNQLLQINTIKNAGLHVQHSDTNQ